MDQAYDGINPQAIRGATTFRGALGASGQLTIWTPASGKRFNLLFYVVDVTANASITAGGAEVALTLEDESTAIGSGFIHTVWIPKVAVETTGGLLYSSGAVSMGVTGYRSSALGNKLHLTVGATLATGKVRVRAWGTEEL